MSPQSRFERELIAMHARWSDTPDQRWLRQNAAAIRAAHADMMREKSNEPTLQHDA